MNLEQLRTIPGLKLPDPMPPIPQSEISNLKSEIPQTTPSTPSAEKPKTTPQPVPTVDYQRSPSAPHPSGSVPRPSPNEPKASQSAPKPSQPDPAAAAELKILAAEFRDLRDKRSPLDDLTDAEHDAILELLENYSFGAVAKLLAQPRPTGLDIQTSDGSLKRFVRRRVRNQRRQEQRDKLAQTQAIVQKSGSTDGFLKASSYLLETRLLKTVTDDETNLDKLQHLIKSLTTLRRQSLAERQQTHREQKQTTA